MVVTFAGEMVSKESASAVIWVTHRVFFEELYGLKVSSEMIGCRGHGRLL